jgi:two-component system LytT family response regulator
MRAVIIDDSTLNIDLVRLFCRRYAPSIEVVGSAENVEDGISELLSKKPDLLFLDVQLDHQTGFDILKAVEMDDLMVVMITAYENYAVQAFRAKVIDYLLKPLVIKHFIQAVQKCEEELMRRRNPVETENRFLSIVNKDHFEMIPIDSILHLQAQGTYTLITMMSNEKHTATRPMNHFEPKLPVKDFVRVHHSHIININGISKISRNRNGKILMNNHDEIPISENKRKEILDRLVK